MACDRCGQRPAQGERREREACHQRTGGEHTLGVQGDEGGKADQHHAHPKRQRDWSS